MNRLLLVPALGVVGLVLASPASAQFAGTIDLNRPTYTDEARQPYNESRRVAYDNGYREGIREGEREGRSRNAFNYQDERTWQRADKGYHRSFGDSVRYQQSFRTGYAAGYSDGYRRYAPDYGYRGNGNGGVYPNTRGGYPGQGGYGYPGQGGYGAPGQDGYGYSPAYSNGTNDGYEKGREDARDRDCVRSAAPQVVPRRRSRLRESVRPAPAVRERLSRGLQGRLRTRLPGVGVSAVAVSVRT